MPAIEILPFFTKWIWCFSIKHLTWASLSPVYENIPIWSVMWFHVPKLTFIITWCLKFLKFSSKDRSHLNDTSSNCTEFIFPLLKIGGIIQNSFNDSGAVDWWTWVVGTNDHLQLTENSWSCLLILSNNVKSSDSFSVHTHILCIWLWDKHAESLLGEVSDWPSVLDEVSGGEPLVSSIEIWNQVSLLHDLSNLFPIILGWINTGWVMSSGVHQNDVSCLSLSIKAVKVVIDLGLSCGWVVVRVLIKLKTCSVNDVVVVGPSGIWDPTEWWKLLVDKLKTDSQWSSAW